MSTEFDQNAVSSLTSVINSIENDRQVYRWFLIFISLAEIKRTLCVEDKIKAGYQTLKRIQITEIMTYLVLGLIIVASYLIKQPWMLLAGGIPLVILVNLFRKNRRCVAMISEQFLIKSIQPEKLNRQTLYETCEYLSQQYNIPSLVDIITFQDTIGRKVLLGAILFIPFIYPFRTWQIVVVIIMVFLATLAIVNTSFVLRKLKSAGNFS